MSCEEKFHKLSNAIDTHTFYFEPSFKFCKYHTFSFFFLCVCLSSLLESEPPVKNNQASGLCEIESCTCLFAQ